MKIFWLASYPKSGNTWLRFLLYSYLYGDISSSNDISGAIPDVHTLEGLRIDPDKINSTVLCKTHFEWSTKHPNYEETAGFIYLMRHPKDVLLSNLNYFQLSNSELIDRKAFARRFIDNLGIPEWREAGIGSWHEHAESWLENNPHPHVMLHYEDLHENVSVCLEKILRLLGVEPDSDRVSCAIEASSFRAMRKLELEERSGGEISAIFQSVLASGTEYAFMSQGKVRHDLSVIDRDMNRYFDEKFGQYLKKYGY